MSTPTTNRAAVLPNVAAMVYDSALAMVADLERSHGVTLTAKEIEHFQSAIAEGAMRAIWGTRWWKRHIPKGGAQ